MCDGKRNAGRMAFSTPCLCLFRGPRCATESQRLSNFCLLQPAKTRMHPIAAPSTRVPRSHLKGVPFWPFTWILYGSLVPTRSTRNVEPPFSPAQRASESRPSPG
ncbi:hypothetical protein BJX68DRAFT_160515 [Aspergillus pseudodeflectus]|uniref:Uncharacterized protein n=1 Tax=Aspergillus pseudodeflectus TaxID=176178 RepID=A0ABR4L1U5_9EURO